MIRLRQVALVARDLELTTGFLHDEYGTGTLALVEDDDKGINKYGMWVGSSRIKVGVPEVVPVYDAWADEEEDEPDVDPVEDDILEAAPR